MAERRLDTPTPANRRAPAFWLEHVAGLAVALAAISCIGLFPDSASQLGRELHNGVLLPLAFCVLAAVALKLRGAEFPAWSLTVVAGFFLLQLWWLWYSGASDTMLVGGLLPFSDASDYLFNAQLLAGGERFQGQNGANEHALATSLLAVLWKSTQGDYRLTLALVTLLGAASAWLAMAEVSLLLGVGAGAVWLLADILFLRRFVGVPLSEHLGVVLGNLGLALGCRAARLGRHQWWVLASFALTLALFARPGAMLTIPALIGAAFLAWPRKDRRRWVLPSAMAGAALAAFLLDKVSVKLVGNPNPEASVSNAAYVLHSLVYGGTWTDAMNRYGNDRLAVWHAVEVQLRAHPFSLLMGGERSLMAFARQGYLFGFVNARWLNIFLHLAFATGAVAVVLALRRDRRAWWLFFVLGGLLASMPLLPPWDTDNMRSYAATIPLIAFTAAVGVHAAASPVRRRRIGAGSTRTASAEGESSLQPAGEAPGLGWTSKGMLAAVVVLCALPPLLFRPRVLPPTRSLEDTYRENRTDGSIAYLPGIALKLVPDSAPRGVLALRLADFRAGLGGFGRLYPGEAALLASLPAGCMLLPGSHEFHFYAVDGSHVPDPGRPQAIDLRFRFVADGWLLLAVDEALLARSPALAAYDSAAIGAFSFGINRFPVIRAGDTVTLVENVSSIDFLQPPRSGANINSIKPFIMGSRRFHCPVAGEYYLRVNQHYPLKLLVIDRDATTADANAAIRDFVASNCVVDRSGGARQPGEATAVDPVRFFESETPAPLSRNSMLQLVALLETCANHSAAK